MLFHSLDEVPLYIGDPVYTIKKKEIKLCIVCGYTAAKVIVVYINDIYALNPKQHRISPRKLIRTSKYILNLNNREFTDYVNIQIESVKKYERNLFGVTEE